MVSLGMDRQITALDNLLRELDALGMDVGAVRLELKSMRYHLEMFDSAAREIGEVIGEVIRPPLRCMIS